jgi:hypothetical protein
MKSLIRAAVVVTILAIPVASFAQESNGPLTRAQVRAELIQLENAGWHPAIGSDPHYPDDILAAEARVAAKNRSASDTGGVVSGASASGVPATGRPFVHDTIKSTYAGH